MIIGAFEYIKRTSMQHEFIKDSNMKIRAMSEKISAIQSKLISQINVLRKYIYNGDISMVSANDSSKN